MAIIRLAQETDAPSMLSIYGPYVKDTPVSFEEVVPSPHEFADRIRNTAHRCPWLLCQIEETVAGYTYATDHRTRSSYRWTKEISVYVHPEFRRKKIGCGLYTALIGLLRVQGVVNVLAGITLPNTESVGFHESFGFKKVGVYNSVGYKNGTWHDVGWWELRLDDTYQKPPDSILHMPDIHLSPEWTSCIRRGEQIIASGTSHTPPERKPAGPST